MPKETGVFWMVWGCAKLDHSWNVFTRKSDVSPVSPMSLHSDRRLRAVVPDNGYASRILSFPAVFAFAAGNQNNIPRRFAIPGLDEMLRLFKEEVCFQCCANINLYITSDCFIGDRC